MEKPTKLKPIPKFKSEDDERAFWDKNDSTEYFDWQNAERIVFPDLKLTTKSTTNITKSIPNKPEPAQ